MHCVIIVITVFVCTCFLIVFLNCYSAIRLSSRKCEIKLNSGQFSSVHFCVLVSKFGAYSILQLFAYSRSLGTSFELLNATIGPWASLLKCSDIPVENALRNVKDWGNQILTLTKTFLRLYRSADRRTQGRKSFL